MEIDVSIFKNNIKKNIRLLIENGNVSEAKELLFQYEAMVYNDLDVYAIKGVIAILEDKTVDAERFLMEGLEFNKNDFDLLYNLAYLYQSQGKFDLAVNHYKKALIYSKSDEDGEDAYLKLRELGITESKNELKSEVKLEESLKIVFFHKKGMDSFLGDIIDNLSKFYQVKKVEVTDFSQINEEMKHASICWFEWCDELVIYAASLKRESNCKIVCRLHSYEAFTSNISKVNWEMIDLTIFVAEHIKNYVIENSNINALKCVVIPNSVNISKWTFKNRNKGNKIAYVGYINYKKGPQLLIQAILSMIKLNPNFEFHIAGEFQDARDVLYFNQVIKEKKLQKNLYYHGWIDDLDSWLEDKNYLICTSVLESQNMSIMQGMAKGIKPLIHNFVGANSIYNKNLIWTTIDELLHLTETEYEPQEYRYFIEENYSIEKQIKKIRGGLSSITIDSSKVMPFNYNEYWNQRLNSKFDIEGVGYIGLGVVYNKFMYQMRFEILNYVLENIYDNVSSKSVLELGPGIGMFTNFFKERNVGKYKGVDIAQISVDELSKEFPDYEFVNGDISEMAYYEKSKYDLIFAADVLLHLTDESKYSDTLRNISRSLSNDGYAILLDPISMKNVKSQSPHVIIRSLEYIVDVVDQFDLELVSWLPTAFFMNYPFDSILLKDKSAVANRIFDIIQNLFSSELLSENEKYCLGELLINYEKECLLKYGIGLSQKMIIVKKKSNINQIKLNILDVWNLETIKERKNSVTNSKGININKSSNALFTELNSLINQLLV